MNDELKQYIQIAKEQQGFRENRSTVDAIFIFRHNIVEKSIEYDFSF